MLCNLAGIDGHLTGDLRIPNGAERSGLVETLNEAVNNKDFIPSISPSKEGDIMSKPSRQALQTGRVTHVRKSDKLHAPLPLAVTRRFTELLDEAEAAAGRYEYYIDEFIAGVDDPSQPELAITPTTRKGIYRLRIHLPQDGGKTFVGELTLPNKSLGTSMTATLQEAALEVCENRKEKRTAETKQRFTPPAENVVVSVAPPPVALPTTVPTGDPAPPQPQEKSLIEQVRALVTMFQENRKEADNQLKELEARLSAEIENIKNRYRELRQPLVARLATCDTQINELEIKEAWLVKYR